MRDTCILFIIADHIETKHVIMCVWVISHMVFVGSHIDWLFVGGFWPEQVVSKHSWAPRWIGCDCAYYSYIYRA